MAAQTPPGSRRSCRRLFGVATLVCALAQPIAADAVTLAIGDVLYDAASDVLPNQAPWQWTFAGSGSSQLTVDGLLTLTSDGPQQVGYNLFNGPTLDRSAGFRIEFGLQIVSESHSSPNRSGSSLIVLDSQARGVELSFWTDTVFVKNADNAFSQGEGRALDTTAQRRYVLEILGDAYRLDTPGMTTLAGVLRNYVDDAADTLFEKAVYGQANYLFFGDNTTSAGAQVVLRDIVLTPVPEADAMLMLLAGMGVVAWSVRRRGRQGFAS